ncbi:MAG: STAS-like domain-containing protein [Bacteroidetes bacterium]|nr:STAS-like domain-containing protein [Bacteroidota bacterium]
MVILISDITQTCYSNDDGDAVYKVIKPYLIGEEPITLSFGGIDGVTSSFVNSAFIQLLDSVEYDAIRKNLHITKATRRTRDMIRDRFIFETQERQD